MEADIRRIMESLGMVVTHWILEVGNTRVKWAAFSTPTPCWPLLSTWTVLPSTDFSALERWKTQVGAQRLGLGVRKR